MPFRKFYDSFPSLCHQLEQVKANQRTGQAYLLIGDDPKSLMDFAMAWAQTAACTGNSTDGKACGQCTNCVHFSRNSYPECLIVKPESKSRQITIESMRQFDEQLSMTSSAGHLKIGIISEAECLGDEAQNAFLKTLEEPPANTMLLLLTSVPRKLLPTIRSRCQRILLLKNKREYQEAAQYGLFPLLATIHRNAGVKPALEASSAIQKIFSELKGNAENFVNDNWDQRWETTAEDNKSLKKQLEDQKKMRIDAEYVRLRSKLVEAIQIWFQTKYLIAAGASAADVLCPEMTEAARPLFDQRPSVEDAEEECGYVNEYVDCLKANVDEALALDTMLLQICEKR